MKRMKLHEIEAMYRELYGPGGSYRYDEYSRSTQLKFRRECASWLTRAKGKDAARLRGTLAGITACLDAGREDARFARRVGYRQEGGDDGYHYVVRVDGRRVAMCLTRSEAVYCKRRHVARLKKEAAS